MKENQNDLRNPQSEEGTGKNTQPGTQGGQPRQGSGNQQQQNTNLGTEDEDTAQSTHETEDDNREAGMGGGAPQQGNANNDLNKNRQQGNI